MHPKITKGRAERKKREGKAGKGKEGSCERNLSSFLRQGSQLNTSRVFILDKIFHESLELSLFMEFLTHFERFTIHLSTCNCHFS